MEESAARQPAPAASPTLRRVAYRMILWAMSVGFAAFIGLCVFLDQYGQREQAQPAQAIVVLGSRVLEGGIPGDSLRARTLHAVTLYHRGLAPALICTGGVGEYPPAESYVARELAMANGVPAAAIFTEDTSTSTWTNAQNAAAICRAQGWTRVIIVSDPYHLWRGRHHLAVEGITAYPSPARACLRNRVWTLRIQWTTREGLAVIKDLLLAPRARSPQGS